jgi:2-iminobutanoate/2-iminopropanoate deaminase
MAVPLSVNRLSKLTLRQFEKSTGFDKAILKSFGVAIGADRDSRRSGRISIMLIGCSQFERDQFSAPIHSNVQPSPSKPSAASQKELDMKVDYLTPPTVMKPIGPYSHIARAGAFIRLGAVAGVDPETGELAGPGVEAQTEQIIKSFEVLLGAAGSNLDCILHINVFLKDMRDFDLMNAAYVRRMGSRRLARTAIAVADLPKPGALLTMDLTAVAADGPPP